MRELRHLEGQGMGPDEAPDAVDQNGHDIRRRIEGVAFWVGLISSLLGLSVAVVWLKDFAIPRQYELVVWIKEATALYPTEETGEASLPFQIGDIRAETASLVHIEAKNFGTSALGTQDELWTLTLASSASASLMVIGQPVVSAPLVLHVPETLTTGTLAIRLGVMEPGSQVDLRLLVLNDPRPASPSLQADWSLQGLPRPIATPSAPSERLAVNFFPATSAAWLVILVLMWWQLDYRRDPTQFATKGKVLGALLLILAGTALFGFVTANILGWAASWVV